MFISISTIFGSCSRFVEGLSYGLHLQEEILEKYDSDEVEVSIKNNFLTVSLIDNNFYSYSDSEKQEMVREIGAIASSLENKPELSGGEVKFVTKGLNGIVKTSSSDAMSLQLE